MRILSWQHVNVNISWIHYWVDPSLLLSSFITPESPTKIWGIWGNVEATSWRFRWCVWICIWCYFGRSVARFPKGNTRNTLFTKYRNTAWKYTRNTKIGVHHRKRRVQRFPWGSGRPTLRNIALTTSAIWGKYTFYEIQKYGLKIREIRVHHRKRCVQRFPWVKTLWGSGRPTLCNIPLTRFGGNTEIRLENTRNTKIRVHHRKRRVQRFSWV